MKKEKDFLLEQIDLYNDRLRELKYQPEAENLVRLELSLNLFDDFDKLTYEMKEHEHEIFPRDIPQLLTLGWTCVNDDCGKAWYIKIKALKIWINSQSENKKDLLNRMIQSHEGKLNYVAMINDNISEEEKKE